MNTKLICALIALLILPMPAQAAKWQRVTNKAQIPDSVYRALNDCPYVTQRTDEWLNGDNLAIIKLPGRKRMFFSSCDASATQLFSAIVIEHNGKAQRQIFDYYEKGRLNPNFNFLANATWRGKSKTLTALFSAGCASQSGSFMRYKWTGKRFKLIKQQESKICQPYKLWPTIYQTK